MSRQRILDHENIKKYIFAGNATFTVVSSKTGTRFTYRIVRAKGDDATRPYFVMVLTGSNNEFDYTYAGFIWADNPIKVVQGRKGHIDSSAPSIVALNWVLQVAARNPEALSKIEFWHEGKCGACGRTLTVPESIASGMGPVCAGRAHLELTPAVPEDIAIKTEEQKAEQAADDRADDDSVDIYEWLGANHQNN